MTPQDPILSQLMAEMDHELEAMSWSAGRDEATSRFLSRLLHLGLRLHRSPGRAASEPVQSFLARCKGPLLHALSGVESYARGLAEMNAESWEESTSQGPFAIDHWKRACSERSALQFLLDLFPGFFEGERGAQLSEMLAESDEQFRLKVSRGEATPHPEEVPAGAPGWHWWWRSEGE